MFNSMKSFLSGIAMGITGHPEIPTDICDLKEFDEWKASIKVNIPANPWDGVGQALTSSMRAMDQIIQRKSE